ncbi:bifunctional DNA primase/polymerase [Leucobacter chinensis]|uniref:bifunctional DNA primase/polymerase n=1 Tax=Leucobacter chinensis TaxID=2851010 RepID=UPI001C21E782|nr:bifunctional DNA primase/polymerase [Leucobacter chinensis]
MTDPTPTLLPARLSQHLPDAAAAYAAAGIAVFPCVPVGKRPLTEHGFHDATTDLDQVGAWWRKHPETNIGIATGHGVDVIDVDVHATGTGFPVLRALQQEDLIAGWGLAVRSPSGGLHLYYPSSPDSEARSWSRGRAHVDFRGAGGYIIAPPSIVNAEHGQRRYEVIAHGRSPRPVDSAAIRDLLTPTPAPRTMPSDDRPGRDGSVEGLVAWVGTLMEGNRNAGLFWAACRLAETGLSHSDSYALLEAAATRTGLEAREIASTIQSAHRTTALNPDAAASDPILGRSFAGMRR